MTWEQRWDWPQGGAGICHPSSPLRDLPASTPSWGLKSEALSPEPTASSTLSLLEHSSGDPLPEPPPEDPEKGQKAEKEDQGLSEPGLSNFVTVLRRRNFLLLWMGQACSQLADKVLLVLLIGLVAREFQPEGASISGWVSAIMLAFTLPAMLLGKIGRASCRERV